MDMKQKVRRLRRKLKRSLGHSQWMIDDAYESNDKLQEQLQRTASQLKSVQEDCIRAVNDGKELIIELNKTREQLRASEKSATGMVSQINRLNAENAALVRKVEVAEKARLRNMDIAHENIVKATKLKYQLEAMTKERDDQWRELQKVKAERDSLKGFVPGKGALF